ncbi:penicillin-binding transpeptidase domain-containing protein [Lederbergia sp. NSJ-179]|uniref:penicillin-binding transpeptidase domain-containing protein n=1 Tax=Lederbergia sp. NSJ-179 TaxID=2931402 RepID=UPI001FD30325|nr:penicillin-binding transpeptidase domain-containing protein [Lederbergia sp. NSJ-179]MCJ7843615.1 penicillin-binding transpeptidase domain-containing protein [Lederbergia sp. NSJ-179]
MKKGWFLILLIFLIAVISGCSDKVTKPEDCFAEYVKLWESQDFDKMYDYLTTETKKNVAKKDFVDRYNKIYKDLEIQKLSIQYTKPETETDKKAKKIKFPFHVKMNSLAGEIAFDQQANWVKEEDDDKKTTEWRMKWDTTFIFPDLEEGDKISVPTIPPIRGAILDRNGIALAENGTGSQIGLVPKKMEGKDTQVIQQMAKLLGISEKEIEDALNQAWVKPDLFVPIKTISANNTELREKLLALPGVQVANVEARIYPLGERAAHLTGNLSPVTAEDLEKHKDKGYTSTDMIGKRGLELVFEDRLRGEPGVQIIIKKEDGSEKILAEKEVQNGEDVELTIDSALQTTIYDELQGKPGAAAAIDPTTGETLALVSSPAYDPNVLTLGATNDQWKKLQDDPKQPMLNRFNSAFAPGSVLKPITAAIGLKNGTITWDQALTINGKGWQKDKSWGKYEVKRVSDPGVPIDLEKALIYSDNIYFAQKTIELGKEKFEAGLKNFGFAEDMPYVYPMHQSTFGEIGSDIALADSSYGQGQIEMSVLHLATTYSTFVHKGNMVKPILEAKEDKGQIWKKDLLTEDQANHLSAALRKVVDEGTARGARLEGFPLAGKTGTAEYEKAEQGIEGKENGWFVAYNPEKPDLVIALMVQEGGSAGAIEHVKNIFKETR